MREFPLNAAIRRLRALASPVHSLRCLGKQDGQVLVEFALVLPILAALVFGIIDFGKAYNSKNNLNFLANQAARFAEVNSCAPCAPGPPAQLIDSYIISTADTSQLRTALVQ